MLLHHASQYPRRAIAIFGGLIVPALLASANLAGAAETPKGLQLLLTDSTQKASTEFVRTGKYGLVVGINNYEHAAQGITPLRFAVPDARAVYSALVDPRRGGFSPDHVTLLTDDSPEKPTNTAIGKALNRLITGTNEGDLVVIYFSGHGYEEEGRAYLLPENADLEALDYSAIERDAFVRQIDKIPAKKVIVVLDACHSGGVNRGGKGAGKDAALSAKYYESFAAAQGRAYIASSSGGEMSWEDETKGHGVFTSALDEALSGAADTAPKDGIITLNEVRGYLETRVSDWAGRRGKSQHPQINLEAGRGDIPMALDYSFLESQSKDLTDRRDLATRLRTGLASMDGLTPTEATRTVDVVNRYGRAESLSDNDAQLFQFAQKLVDGSIDINMFRAGVSKLIEMSTPEQVGLAPKRGSIFSNKWFLGGVGVAVIGVAAAAGGGHSAAPTGPATLADPPPPPGP